MNPQQTEALRALADEMQRQHDDGRAPWIGPNDIAMIRALAARSPAPSAGVMDDAMEALRWYAEQAELCRKLGRDGDAGRQALDADGGKRARAALSQHPAAPSVSPAVAGDGLAVYSVSPQGDGQILKNCFPMAADEIVSELNAHRPASSAPQGEA